MRFHIRRDDGRYLVGPGATATSEKPEHSYSLANACAAITRYRLVASVYCPQRKDDGFTFVDAALCAR